MDPKAPEDMTMPLRTNKQAVQVLLAYNWSPRQIPDVTPFIQGANMVIDMALSYMRDRKFFYTAEQLELLERYLAAHFYCKADPLYMSKSTGGASGGFQRQGESGFQLTEYGRGAVEMDVSGVLNAIGKRQVASMFWGGTRRPCWGQVGWPACCVI